MTDQLLTQYTTTPDNLIAGNKVIPMTEEITLLSGENRARGTVLGKITKGAVTAAVGAGNTGNATIGSAAAKARSKVGTYMIVCLTATTFRVIDPEGFRLADGAFGSAYDDGNIGFTITEGSTPCAAGDSFTVVIAAGSGKYKMSLAAAVDGSQDPARILAEAVDASLADKTCAAYKRGEFNKSKLTLGTGHTTSSIQAGLEAIDIYLKDYVE